MNNETPSVSVSSEKYYIHTGIIFCMHPANERWCYNVTSSLIGWADAQKDPCSHLISSDGVVGQ